MKKKILAAIALFMLFLCHHPLILHAFPVFPADMTCYIHVTQSWAYKVIQAPNNTWGYDILQDNKVFIHQPNKPGISGNNGFSTKQDATKVAKLVIIKIKRGEMPPTVSIEELKKLKVAL